MSYKIPETSADCARCLLGGRDYVDGVHVIAPCDDHRDAAGAPAPYTGPDKYEPTSWVRGIHGRFYRSWDTFVYRVIGYDPRSGVLVERVGVAALGGDCRRARALPQKLRMIQKATNS